MEARTDRPQRWSGRGARLAAGFFIGGAALVALSLLPSPGPDASWLRDFLMTVGSSLALFAPLYLVTRSLDTHLDRVEEETAQQVQAVRTETAEGLEAVREDTARQVDAVRADVDRRLGDVAAQVAARLAAEAEDDRAVLAALRTEAPSREGVWAALELAQGLALVTAHRPPRVMVASTAGLYVAAELDLDDFADEPLQFRVEDARGTVQDWVPWPDGQDAEDTLVDVGRAVYKHTSGPFDAAALLVGLADLLQAALSHPERRPAIELCPPQWMVCDWGVVTYDARVYSVGLRKLQTSDTIFAHVASKPWVDEDSWDAAYTAAQSLFPTWGDGGDEPPF